MMLRRIPPLVSVFCLLVAAVPAIAQQDLYDNGPTDGFDLNWTINFGFSVSDQFTLSSDSTVNGITFAAWMFPGDTLESVEVAITSSEFGGTSFFDQIVNFTQGSCFSNGGFNICNETGNFAGVQLNAGSYWLNLSNASVANGDPVGWDANFGPSLASATSVGTIPSESFTILGSNSGNGTTPEPCSLVLLGTGIFGLGTLLRRKLS